MTVDCSIADNCCCKAGMTVDIVVDCSFGNFLFDSLHHKIGRCIDYFGYFCDDADDDYEYFLMEVLDKNLNCLLFRDLTE